MKNKNKSLNESISSEYIGANIVGMIKFLSVVNPSFVYVKKTLKTFNTKFLARLNYENLTVAMTVEPYQIPQCFGTPIYRNFVNVTVSNDCDLDIICTLCFRLNADETTYTLNVSNYSTPTDTVTISEIDELAYELSTISMVLRITNIEKFTVCGNEIELREYIE